MTDNLRKNVEFGVYISLMLNT